MMTIQPHISIPPAAIVATNVSDISQARVIILLGDHERSPNYYRHCQSIQAIVEALYKPQDIILVEDPWNRKKAELIASHIPDLSRDKYNIEGWDDPEACRQAEEVGQFAQKVQEAVDKVRCENSDADYQWLISIAGPIFGIPQDDLEKSHFLSQCEEYYLNSAEGFTISRFYCRNETALSRTHHHLEARKGRVIEAMGPEHAVSENEHIQPACRKLIDGLANVTYIILNADKV